MASAPSVISAMPLPGQTAPLSALNDPTLTFPAFAGAPYNASLPTKLWIATEDVNGNPVTSAEVSVTFGSWVSVNGMAPTFVTFTMSGAQALATNIPGPVGTRMYPAWSPSPTAAIWTGVNGVNIPVDPATLSTLAEAQAIATAWGLNPSAAVTQLTTSPEGSFTPNGETRGVCQIAYGTVIGGVNAGFALTQQNQYGVGSPGSWELLTGAQQEPVWVPAPGAPFLYPVANAAGPIPQVSVIPSPVIIEAGPLGMGWQLFNPAGAPTPTGTGGLTALEHNVLIWMANNQYLQMIADRVQPTGPVPTS